MLDLQFLELLLKLNEVFVNCFPGADFLRKPVLQLGRIAALDLLDRHLALDLGNLLLDLVDDKLFATAVDIIAAEVAIANVLAVSLDLQP